MTFINYIKHKCKHFYLFFVFIGFQEPDSDVKREEIKKCEKLFSWLKKKLKNNENKLQKKLARKRFLK